MGATHYLKVIHGRKEGLPPRLSFDLERRVQQTVTSLIRRGLVRNAHDCSEGGLGVALAECCISGEKRIGASLNIGSSSDRMDLLLFNETQSRVIVSVAREHSAEAEKLCIEAGIPFCRLGEVGGTELVVRNGKETLRWDVTELYEKWYLSIEHAMSTR